MSSNPKRSVSERSNRRSKTGGTPATTFMSADLI
jgi:hypothetical protein